MPYPSLPHPLHPTLYTLFKVFLSFVLAAVIILCNGQPVRADATTGSKETMGAWETLPMPDPANYMQSVHTTLLPNGKVLIVNGSSFRSTVVDEEGEKRFVEGVDVKDDAVVNNTALLDPKTGQLQRISSPKAVESGEANDLFCAGHLQLADGNVLFVSGTGRYYPGGGFTGSRQLNLYNWKTNEWSYLGQLKEGRWYPTLVSLADGKIVIFSGLKLNAPNQINPSLEIYDPKTNQTQYIDLTTVPNSPFNTKLDGTDPYDSIDLYPRVFPTADNRLLITGDEAGIGTVLVPHTSKKSYFMSVNEDINGNFNVSFEVGPERGETSKAYSTGLQVPNEEDVLLFGGIIGTNDINFGRGGNTAGYPPGSRVATSLQRWLSPSKTGEKNGKWEIVPDFLDKPRANVEAVILPTKQILVVNGGQYPEYLPVFEPLLLTPDAQSPGGYRTQPMNEAKLPRLYHNGAVLLPDARVLILGGNANRAGRGTDGTLYPNVERDSQRLFKLATLYDANGQPKEFSLDEYYQNPKSYFLKDDKEPYVPGEIWQGEIFSPPYLFKPGVRPEIVNAPETINYGQSATLSVKNATEKGSLVLVKLGTVTHSFDFGQRLADLGIETVSLGDESSITFKAPENPHLYPPGYYMVFYLNELGKPSESKMVKLQSPVS